MLFNGGNWGLEACSCTCRVGGVGKRPSETAEEKRKDCPIEFGKRPNHKRGGQPGAHTSKQNVLEVGEKEYTRKKSNQRTGNC